MEPRNLLGLVREWDFFFLHLCSFFKASGSLSLLGRSVGQGTPLGEVFLVCKTLLCLPIRLMDLLRLYLRLGVPDPYHGRYIVPHFWLGNPKMSHSSFNSSSQSEDLPLSSPEPTRTVPCESPQTARVCGISPSLFPMVVMEG